MLPTVLFVDDEIMLLEGIRRSLWQNTSFRALYHSRPQSALSLVASEQVDVVVVDYDMPGMNGLELLQRLKREHPRAVRVLLTGRTTLEIVKRAINEAEVFRFLEKPLVRDELHRAVTQAIAQARTVRDTDRPPQHDDERLARLSEREREIVGLVAAGFRANQIAKMLCISTHTVRNHLKSSYRKLDIHSQHELVEHYGARSSLIR